LIKILIGGSPCTYWSIAQTNNRETKAEGMGWELFKNYLIAKEKFKPDFFLYENNKSAAQAIKDQIAEELGVGVDPDVRFAYINSALVSAQNRQRFYVTNFGDIEQPEDRGILLKDILETGYTDREKGHAVISSAGRTTTRKYFDKQQGTMALEPLTPFVEGKLDSIVEKYGYLPERFNPYNKAEITDKSPCLTTCCGSQTSSSTAMLIEPVGAGGKTGFYAIKVDKPIGYATPCEWDENGTPTKAVSCADGKTYTVFEVKDGQITIKGKRYPIKLVDGYYIIRKLTVRECARLQTMPDDYCKAVSDSQAYKALGNGWTAEVIIHLLNHALKDVPRDEEIVVLSMYDGIATGRHCLHEMGFTNVTYHAYEIDKYPIMVAMDNYPDIIQHGDAFAVREDDWQSPA
jgi:DNA (cytosine-5)-methyltransferase 3A